MSNKRVSDEQATVLVVDDEVETADLHADFLTEEYTVRTAYSGEEALELLDPTVSVVLLDRRMPVMSGDDVLKTIRARDIDCSVVLVTAVDPDIDVLDLPFDDYLRKPVSPDEMRDAVSRMHARQTAVDSMREIFALASKMAMLESKMSIQELEDSAEYADLQAQFEELRGETGLHNQHDGYTEFTTEKIRTLFA